MCCRRPTCASGRSASELLLATTPDARQGVPAPGARTRRATDTQWPEAHYLSPAAPGARLGRRPRARAARPQPGASSSRGRGRRARRVLLLGTLTNGRGQVVLRRISPSAFLDPEPGRSPDRAAHGRAERAGGARAATQARQPRGRAGPDALQRARRARGGGRCRPQMRGAVRRRGADARRAASSAGRHRVAAAGTHEADALEPAQRAQAAPRRASQRGARAGRRALRPDRQLVRPLLVVVPPPAPGRCSA